MFLFNLILSLCYRGKLALTREHELIQATHSVQNNKSFQIMIDIRIQPNGLFHSQQTRKFVL